MKGFKNFIESRIDESLDMDKILMNHVRQISNTPSLIDNSVVGEIASLLSDPEKNMPLLRMLLINLLGRATQHQKITVYEKPILGNILKPENYSEAEIDEFRKDLQSKLVASRERPIFIPVNWSLPDNVTTAEITNGPNPHFSCSANRRSQKVIMLVRPMCHVYSKYDVFLLQSFIMHESVHLNDIYLQEGMNVMYDNDRTTIEAEQRYMESFAECRANAEGIKDLIVSYMMEHPSSNREVLEKMHEYFMGRHEPTALLSTVANSDEYKILLLFLATEIIRNHQDLIIKKIHKIRSDYIANEPKPPVSEDIGASLKQLDKDQAFEVTMQKVEKEFMKIWTNLISPTKIFKDLLLKRIKQK